MRKDYYKLGDNNVICDRTGFKVKASKCSYDHGRRGMGNTLFVRNSNIDKPQMQDYVKGVADDQMPSVVRSEPPDRFISGIVDPYTY
jgi:hypothetical protein